MPQRLARMPHLIAGSGGHLLVKRSAGLPEEDPTDIGKAYENTLSLDIHRYRVRHRYIWTDTTHSGSDGAILRTLIAQDFNFVAEIPWNSREVQSREGEAVGFVEEILLGNVDALYNVSILFQLGDPLQYPNPDRRATLHGPEVALTDAIVICDSTGTPNVPGAIIQVNIAGSGNSLLRGLRGSQKMFNDPEYPPEAPPPP